MDIKDRIKKSRSYWASIQKCINDEKTNIKSSLRKIAIENDKVEEIEGNQNNLEGSSKVI